MKMLFDRIIMPLPKTGEEFLDVALPIVKKAGTIHLYAFLSEEEIAPEGKRIIGLCAKLRYKVKLLQAVKCGQFAPRVFRVCFDLRVG
jgi:tRNA G37 N-methylase Trm5